jgi:hypothetical protein
MWTDMMEMWQVKQIRVLGAIVLLGALTACNDSSPTTPTPSVPPTTRVFEGNLTRNGATAHDFTPERGGTITATLTTLGGPDGLEVGLGIGNWFAGACSIIFANDRATRGFTLSSQLPQGGPLCVRIYDAAEQIPAGTSVGYAIEVVHP